MSQGFYDMLTKYAYALQSLFEAKDFVSLEFGYLICGLSDDAMESTLP